MRGSTFLIGDGIYVTQSVHNGKVRLWRRTGQTRNPRVVATAEAASINGVIYSVHVEDGLVLLQHWNGGVTHRFAGQDTIKPAAVTWESVDPLFAEDAEPGGGA